MNLTTALAVTAVLLTGPQNLPADTLHWRSDGAESELRFIARYDGERLEGRFGRFDVHLVAGADTTTPKSLRVEVDVTTADMNDNDVNEALAGPDWFDQARFPAAVYRCDAISPAGDGEILCRGTLVIKGIEHPLEIPMSWKPEPGKARLTGSVELSRRACRIGTGEWLADDTIADGVTVDFEVTLRTGNAPP
jgi:polyisoprenoid-binding protein YceI